MRDSLGANEEKPIDLKRNQTDIASNMSSAPPKTAEKRVRTGSFFSNYQEANYKQNLGEVT